MWGIARLFLFSAALLTCAASQEGPHPLDPLTAEEITATATIIRNYNPEPQPLTFNYIALKEPDKSLLLPYFLRDETPPAGAIPRRSFAVMYNKWAHATFEVTVNLTRGLVETWERLPDGIEPSRYTEQEVDLAEMVAKSHPEVIIRCQRNGWNDMNLVNGDSWSVGYVDDRSEYEGRRLLQLYMQGKLFEGDNEYLHPMDFMVVVDILEERVINIEDLPIYDGLDGTNGEGLGAPRHGPQFNPSLRDPSSFRKDLKPIKITQPGGSSFNVTGNEINWQKFKFRVGFSGREALLIHTVSYEDGDTVRPLFYRMSMAEVFVPYGDPRSPYHRKTVFDEGQFGLGFAMSELTAQWDCLGEVHLFDFVVHDDQGTPINIPSTACLYEEDAGVLWKHYDMRRGEGVLVRSQRLGLTFTATVDNYDYIFTWYFYQDATIEYEARLSGILSLNVLADNSTSGVYGTRVAPDVNAIYHQHFFTLRLDPEIDGTENTVAMVDVVPVEDPTGSRENPYGQGFTTKATVLRTAGEAMTNVSPLDTRTWHIQNPNKMNPNTLGPVAWRLSPFPSVPLAMRQDSPIRPWAAFLDYSTWVTPYNDDQMFPGGLHLNKSGLPEWVAANMNANVDNTDIVLWHNFGLSHAPRVEDYPVMPVEICGIIIKPLNFFNENPSMDVPPPPGGRKSKRKEL